MGLGLGRQGHLHDRLIIRIAALNNRLAHFRRQFIANRGNRITHIVRGFDHIAIEIKTQLEVGTAFTCRCIELGHARNTLQ